MKYPSESQSIEVYEGAVRLLELLVPEDIDLEKYYKGDFCGASTIEDIYDWMIKCATNRRIAETVISYDKRRDKIKEILCGFNVRDISRMDEHELYSDFLSAFDFDPKGTSWKDWTKTCISAARYLSRFETAQELRRRYDSFDTDVDRRIELALSVDREGIPGIRFTMACNFIKELGYLGFSKPDSQLMGFFRELGMTDGSPEHCFRLVDRIAEDCRGKYPDVTPYKIDRMIWLICTGNLYFDHINISPRNLLIRMIDSRK